MTVTEGRRDAYATAAAPATLRLAKLFQDARRTDGRTDADEGVGGGGKGGGRRLCVALLLLLLLQFLESGRESLG